LYGSTLIAILQRLVSLIISWDFDVLGKVTRKRGMFTEVVPPARDRQVVDICLRLIISKQRFNNSSDMSSTGVEKGRTGVDTVD
jgi:hypothetical protein